MELGTVAGKPSHLDQLGHLFNCGRTIRHEMDRILLCRSRLLDRLQLTARASQKLSVLTPGAVGTNLVLAFCVARKRSPQIRVRETLMSARSSSWRYVVVMALLCIAPGALAQIQKLQINNPASQNIVDGIYVGAYGATNLTTGAQVQIVCDDFKDDSDYNPATYTTNSFSSLGSTLWGSSILGAGGSTAQVTQLYDEAAWLVLGMLKQSGTQQGYYSFATWAIFAPSQVAAWLTSAGDMTACNAVFGNGSWGTSGCTAGNGGLVGLASSQTYYAGEFSSILILTPQGCKSGPGTCPEQEFFQVVSEGGAAAVYLLLAGVSCLVTIRYSRKYIRPAGTI
jgi:hypothetical protein